MTTTTTPPTTAPATAHRPAATRPVSLRNVYRFELVKLFAQWRVRILLVVCWLGPAGFVAVVSQQSSLPADTVFGRWMSQTGWAGPLEVIFGPLVILGFYSRYAAFLASGLTAIAYFIAHAPNGFHPFLNDGSLAALYSFTFLYLACAGQGPWAINRK